MTRRRTQIEKIENKTARQITFSKRKRGLFKKAFELSTLCDAEIALLVFSPAGKLFEYSSSCTKQVIERRSRQSNDQEDKLDQPSLELTLEDGESTWLRKAIAEKTLELSQIRGEELQGLKINQLRKLETLLVGNLRRVRETKEKLLMRECDRLKQEMNKYESIVEQNNKTMKRAQGQSAVSAIVSASQSPESEAPYSFLKLGLPSSVKQ